MLSHETMREFLRTRIIPFEALGFQWVETVSGICLKADLKRNENDKKTAFAGSLYSLAVLSGWSLIYRHFQREFPGGQTVIHQAQMIYRQPVKEDFEAFCPDLSAEEWQRHQEALKLKGRAKIDLKALIRNAAEEIQAEFQGSYVISANGF